MDLNYAMSYRITTLEIEQAAVRAERARMAAEHGDQFLRREGVVRRVLRALAVRRGMASAETEAAREAAFGREIAAVPETAAVAEAAATLAPAADSAQEAPTAEDRAGELVGCASHAA